MPASWASGASSEAGWLACLSASVGPDPNTGAGPDAVKGGVGPSSGMATGEPPVVMGTRAVMGDEEVAGMELGVVAGSVAGMADSDIVTPVTTSDKPPSGLLSLPARSIAQINMSHVQNTKQHWEHCPDGADAYQVVRGA